MSLPGLENTLLQIVFLLLLAVHLGFAGLLVGGSGVAILLQVNGIRGRRASRRRLAASLLIRAAPKARILLLLPILGGLNLLALEAAYAPVFERTLLRTAMAVLLLSGLGLLLFHRHRLLVRGGAGLPSAAAGLAGTACILAAYFLLCGELALLLRPEKWPILSTLPVLILSWSAFGKFLQFLSLSLALAGSALLYQTRDLQAAGDEERTARRLGILVALAALLLLPAALFFDLFNMPSLAYSRPFFFALAFALLLGAWLAWRLAGCWDRLGARTPTLLLGGVMTLLLVMLGADHLARAHVLIPQTRPVAAEAEKEEKELGAVSGQSVFERVCSACHAFDRRVVGPPLNEVLPKYAGDRESLEAFIRDPVKVNPDYPAMPKLGLAPEEIAAVAGYLLERGRR